MSKAANPSNGETNDSSIVIGGVTLGRPTATDSVGYRKFTGRKTGKEFYPFCFELFLGNERLALAGNKPYTDAQLEALIKDEFAAYPDLVSKVGQGERKIAKLRSRYNTGRLTQCNRQRVFPELVSLRYGDHGKPINGYNGLPFSFAARIARAKQYKIADPRIESWQEGLERGKSVRDRPRKQHRPKPTPPAE